MVTLIISAYYLIAFDPERDPFEARRSHESTTAGGQPWETNAVDTYIFNLMMPVRVRLARMFGIGSSAGDRKSVRYRKQLERIFIPVSFFSDNKCLLVRSRPAGWHVLTFFSIIT